MSESASASINIDERGFASNVLLPLLIFLVVLLFFLAMLPSTAHAQQIETAARDLKSAQQVANVQVITSVTTLSEQRRGKVYLQITNTSDFLLQIAGIDTTKTVNFIQMLPEGFENGTILAPQQSIIIPYTATTSGAVQPGNQLLVFNVLFAWKVAGNSFTSNIIVTREVTVEILGESQILSLLGIPTFLVLPGFLMLITMRLILSLNSKRPAANLSFLQSTNSEFWLIAITLSILFVPAYIFFTQWYTGSPHNYIVQYDLSDVITVWFVSILLVAIPGLIAKSFYSLFVLLARPKPDDSPIKTLRKLSYRGLSVWCQNCKICEVIDGNKIYKDVFLLEHRAKESRNVDRPFWVCPRIVVKKEDKSGDQSSHLQQEFDKMLEKLEDQKNKPASLQASRLSPASLRACLLTRGFVKLLAQGDRMSWGVTWSLEALQGHTGPFPVKWGDIRSRASSLEQIFRTE